ncbi:MAG: aldehyde dehydrogenase family protein [Planctomycetes bacterium]|nr:aldehyde dehydrogenase family protein [Planctomycetota bacterium]
MTLSSEWILRNPSDFIDGQWRAIPGDSIQSRNPADPDATAWSGAAKPEHVDAAVSAARSAFPSWRRKPLAERAQQLRAFSTAVKANAEALARTITLEMGKTLAESRAEVKLLSDKIDITLQPATISRVADFEVDAGGGRRGFCRFQPFGAVAILGPFNFPAHLPNGHWVPSLLMGNTIIFKPSEKTPATGQWIAALAKEAGFPNGVFNVLQGGVETAKQLTRHEGVDGIMLTGSWPAGRSVLEANLDRPGRIVALEMGGSNPAIIWEDADLRTAVIECVRSGYATTGQRCTCTRRMIVHRSCADRFVTAFTKVASTMVIAPGDAPEPNFMGPLVDQRAAEAFLSRQSDLRARGGRVLLEGVRMERKGFFVTPSLIEVPRFERATDAETFAPLVQVSVVDEFEDAIAQANATEFGLAAAIFTKKESLWREGLQGIKAGCVNWNSGTAGASSKLPFGGTGRSGNLRPAGLFAVDSAAYPVASLEGGADVAVPSGLHCDVT